MDMKQCSKGHFYDASTYSECPYCAKNPSGSVRNENSEPAKSYPSQTMPIVNDYNNVNDNVTIPIGVDATFDESPVVGWLVCIQGPGKGRAYNLHNDNNYIGRSEKSDINLKDDLATSRAESAIVTYDSRSKIFYVGFIGGKSIVRFNDKPLLVTCEMKAYDTIEVGQTKLMFVPLCGEHFDWADA